MAACRALISLSRPSIMQSIKCDSSLFAGISWENGVNIRLAMKLTGYDIDVIREEKPFEEYEDDIELVDLKEELTPEIVELLINNRYELQYLKS